MNDFEPSGTLDSFFANFKRKGKKKKKKKKKEEEEKGGRGRRVNEAGKRISHARLPK